MLGGELAVLQAPVFDGLPFDPFALFDDGFCPAEVGVGGRHVAEAFMVSPVIIVCRPACKRDPVSGVIGV